MASSEEQSRGQAGSWEPPRRRYFPVRPGAAPERPWLDRPPRERAPGTPSPVQPGPVEPGPVEPGPVEPGFVDVPPAPPGQSGQPPALGGVRPPASARYPSDTDASGAGLGKASDLAVTVLAGLGVLGPELAEPAASTFFPVRARRVDLSPLSAGELRREAASCVDDNPGRAKRIVSDWLKS